MTINTNVQQTYDRDNVDAVGGLHIEKTHKEGSQLTEKSSKTVTSSTELLATAIAS